MQYVDLNVVRYAAAILASADAGGHAIYCEVQPCENLAEFLIPDATRPGGGGRDIEQRPAMVCGEHAEEMLGYAPEPQPIFGRLEGPGEE